MVSWSTRIIAQFIAGGYMIEKGKTNTAAEHAATLGYDEVERAMVSDKSNAPLEPKVGSFERLMGWAGQVSAKK